MLFFQLIKTFLLLNPLPYIPNSDKYLDILIWQLSLLIAKVSLSTSQIYGEIPFSFVFVVSQLDHVPHFGH